MDDQEEQNERDTSVTRGKAPESVDAGEILDLSLSQHPMTDLTIGDYTLSQYPLQESRFSHGHRMEPVGIEDTNKNEVNKFHPLMPDNDSRISLHPMEETQDISSGALESSLLEMSGEDAGEEKHTTPTSRELSEGLLSPSCLQRHEDKSDQSLSNFIKSKSITHTEMCNKESHTGDKSLDDTMFCLKQMKDTLETGSDTTSFAERHYNQLSDTLSTPYQPDVNHITIGESYLEKRPISSSTPSSSRYLSQLTIRDSTSASSSEGIGLSSPSKSIEEQSKTGASIRGAGDSKLQETKDDNLPKSPPELIKEAGVTEYMLPEERELLVGRLAHQDTSISQEERNALFSGIFTVPRKEIRPQESTAPTARDTHSPLAQSTDSKVASKCSEPTSPHNAEDPHISENVGTTIKKSDLESFKPIAHGSSMTAAGDCPQQLIEKLAIGPSTSHAVRSVSHSEMSSDSAQGGCSLLQRRPWSDDCQISKPHPNPVDLTLGKGQSEPLDSREVSQECVTESDSSFTSISSVPQIRSGGQQASRQLDNLLIIGPTKTLTTLDNGTTCSQIDTNKTSPTDGLTECKNVENFHSSRSVSQRSSPENKHSRPSSSASADTIKEDQVEGEHVGRKSLDSRHTESPHSQLSELSSVSYRDLPEKLHPSLAPKAGMVSTKSEADQANEKTDSQNSSSTIISDQNQDPDLTEILQKYGEVISDDGTREKSINDESSDKTPIGSTAESDDTDLTNRVSRLLQGSDVSRAYLMEDPAHSMTLPLTSGSTTCSDTPPPTLSNQALTRLSEADVNDRFLAVRSRSEDTLGERVRQLLGGNVSVAGSGIGSSGRSSLSGSVNFDILQSDLDEIQRGLAVLQNGELSFEQMDATSTGTRSRCTSDASEDTVSKVTGSEVGTPRKFSWDYGDLNTEDANGYRFVTSRTDLQTGDESPHRKEPEGGIDGSPKLSSDTDPSTSEHNARSTLEGKYTRIAMQLEKETSPLRKVHSHKTLITSADVSLMNKSSSSFLQPEQMNYKDFINQSIDSEVKLAFSSGKAFSKSEQSLCQKVQDLMERESPQRLAYRYLAEAENSLRHVQERSSVRQHSSDGDLRNISLTSPADARSFHLTPVPHGFSAYGNVRTLLAAQLNKVSAARFDTSIELKSPFKRHMGFRVSPTQTSSSSPELRATIEGSTHNFDEPALRVKDYGAVHGDIDTSQSDYTPSSRAVTMQDYINGTHQTSLAERQKERQRELAEASNHERAERSHQEQSGNRHERIFPMESRTDLPYHDHQSSSLKDKLDVEKDKQPSTLDHGLTPPRDDSAGSSDSVLSSGRRYARTEGHNRSGRSSTTNAGLRPYRPPGSNDLYFVESGTDDGNISVTNSETTVESTHIGSDDAHAPSFPHQWLGSRLEPSTLTSGIYSKRGSVSGSAQTLLPIAENKSFEETKQEYRAKRNDTFIEENFAAQNRSHHNNSGQPNQTDSSSERSDPPAESMCSMHTLEDSTWSADHHDYHQDQNAFGGTPSSTHSHRSESHMSQLVRNTNKALHTFGTPQKHKTDGLKNYTPTPQSQRSQPYDIYQEDQAHGYVDGERTRANYERVGKSSRSQDVSPRADELTARLRLYPGEVHTLDGTLDSCPNRFSPLRPDLDGDDALPSGRYKPVSVDHSLTTCSPSPHRQQPLKSPPLKRGPTPPSDLYRSATRAYTPRTISPDWRTDHSQESRTLARESGSSTIENSPSYSRRGQSTANSVHDVYSNDASPVGHYSGHGAEPQLPTTHSTQTGRERELEQLASQLEPLSKPDKGSDIQGLWERFQQRSHNKSERMLEKRGADLKTLSHLLKNPVGYLVHDVKANRQTPQSIPGYREGGPVEDSIDMDPYATERKELHDAEVDMNVQSRPIEDQDKSDRQHSYRDLMAGPGRYQDISKASGGTASSLGTSYMPHSTKPQTLREETTLQSIPEDSTLSTTDFTSSESNATVSKSTLQLLPDDPKLLKLQTKILRQRQKYEHEKRREQRRREKIQKLEYLLVSKSGRPKSISSREESKQSTVRPSHRSTVGPLHDRRSQPRPSSSSSTKSTSTPSSVRQTSESDVSLTVSEITTDTMTRATIISDQSSSTLIEMELEERDSLPREISAKKYKQDNTSICKCCLKKKSKVRDIPVPTNKNTKFQQRPSSSSPKKSKSPVRQRKDRSPSPLQKRHCSRNQTKNEVPKKHKPKYQHRITHEQHDEEDRVLPPRENTSHLYMEFDNPQINNRSSNSNHGKQTKSNEKGCQKYHTPKNQRKHEYRESSSVRARDKGEQIPRLSPASQEERPTSPSHRTIGVNVPTPVSLSPPCQKNIKDVSMVSEAVQTTPGLVRDPTHSLDANKNMQKGPYSPASDSSYSENVQPKTEGQTIRATASQTGLAWYIPLKDPRPWRQPLRERQANAQALAETWPPRKEVWRSGSQSSLDRGKRAAKTQELGFGSGDDESVKLSLQGALEHYCSDFISKSRERLKHLALKTEERRIQDLHAKQRAELFHVERRLDPNKDAHPYSENLFRPKKRFMTKKEMKELTNKKYATLEEVKKKQVEEKKLEEYRANRIRAQMYKKKVLCKVLNRKAAWTQ